MNAGKRMARAPRAGPMPAATPAGPDCPGGSAGGRPLPAHLIAGQQAEERALAHLRVAGLVPLARNVRYRCGELDLIVRDGATVVFVEVRSRRHGGWGGAAASLGPAKQARLLRAAQLWLQGRYGNRPPPCRFDALLFEGGAAAPRWLRNILTLD